MKLTIVNCHGCGKPIRSGMSRCVGCRIIRRAADKEQKWQAAQAAFPATTRTKLLALLRHGAPLGEVCADLGVSIAMVYGYRRHDPAWSIRLNAALMEGRDPHLDHGTEMAYRHGGCRCPDCRAWKQSTRTQRSRTHGVQA